MVKLAQRFEQCGGCAGAFVASGRGKRGAAPVGGTKVLISVCCGHRCLGNTGLGVEVVKVLKIASVWAQWSFGLPWGRTREELLGFTYTHLTSFSSLPIETSSLSPGFEIFCVGHINLLIINNNIAIPIKLPM